MKTNLTSRLSLLAFLMVMLIFHHPFVIFAQQNSAAVQAEQDAEADMNPFVILDQQHSAAVQAKQDAEADMNKWLWTGAGCAVNLSPVLGAAVGIYVGSLGPQSNTGWAAPSDEELFGCCIGAIVGSVPLIVFYSHKLTPPAERFIGKSPEYIDIYTDAYKTRTQRLKYKYAAIGSAISWGILMISLRAIVDD